jgi:carboxylesterase
MKALVLHGFTGSLDTVSILKAPLEARGLEVAMPVLRGHSAEPDHLHSVHWRDWVSDGRQALRRLAPNDEDEVVIAGLSMGALIACQLAAEFPLQVRRIALLAPAFAFRSRLLHALPVIKRVRRDWPASPDYADPALAATNTNYASFPLEALESVLRYVPVVESLLPHIQCPVGVFFAKNDPAIAPGVPKRLETLLGRDKVTHFTYEKSRHEILQDVEAPKVAEDVVDFLCQDV